MLTNSRLNIFYWMLCSKLQANVDDAHTIFWISKVLDEMNRREI